MSTLILLSYFVLLSSLFVGRPLVSMQEVLTGEDHWHDMLHRACPPFVEDWVTPEDWKCPQCCVMYGTRARNGLFFAKTELKPCGHCFCWFCAIDLWNGDLPPCCPRCFSDIKDSIRLCDSFSIKRAAQELFECYNRH